MRVVLTPDDLKKGDLAEPGWHPAEIIDYQEKEAESDGSTNCIFFFKLIEPSPNKGISCRRLFNEKAMGFAKNLLGAVGYPKNENGGYDIDSDKLKKMVGMKVKIYIKRGESDKGNKFNDVSDFLPIT
jgi:hypothetical protein